MKEEFVKFKLLLLILHFLQHIVYNITAEQKSEKIAKKKQIQNGMIRKKHRSGLAVQAGICYLHRHFCLVVSWVMDRPRELVNKSHGFFSKKSYIPHY